MRRHPVSTGIFVSAALALLSCSMQPAFAQKVTIDNQGQAALNSENARIAARALGQAIGVPATGKGRVVLFRAANSPGGDIEVLSGNQSFGALAPGMYFAEDASPGVHSYGTQGGVLPIEVAAGKTYYVQVIRDRSGQSRVRVASADKFRRLAGP